MEVVEGAVRGHEPFPGAPEGFPDARGASRRVKRGVLFEPMAKERERRP